MKMTKSLKERGYPRVNDMVKEFQIGDYAAIKINPSEHNGMPFHNFQGKTGIIVEKQGECYVLEFKVGKMHKRAIAAPVHLKHIETAKA